MAGGRRARGVAVRRRVVRAARPPSRRGFCSARRGFFSSVRAGCVSARSAGSRGGVSWSESQCPALRAVSLRAVRFGPAPARAQAGMGAVGAETTGANEILSRNSRARTPRCALRRNGLCKLHKAFLQASSRPRRPRTARSGSRRRRPELRAPGADRPKPLQETRPSPGLHLEVAGRTLALGGREVFEPGVRFLDQKQLLWIAPRCHGRDARTAIGRPICGARRSPGASRRRADSSPSRSRPR